MGVIAETTNKVIVMRHGVIVEQGNTKDLLTNPKSTEARSLVISVPPTNKKIDRFKLISPDGKEITSSSANLTKNIIKTWGIRENSNQKLLKVSNITKIFDDNSLSNSKKINDEKVYSDMSFSKMELLKFCIRSTLNEFYDNDEFLFDVFWSLFDMNIEEINYENGTEDTYLEVEDDSGTKIKNVDMVYNDVILKCEKLYEEISKNEEKFKGKMILFDDNK